MSGGGATAYKHPMTPWGGRMRSNLKLSKGAKGVSELLRRRNTWAFCNTSLLEEQMQKSYNIHEIVGTDWY